MRRVKASHVQSILIIVAVVALLSWGVLGVLSTSPNEQGEIINKAVKWPKRLRHRFWATGQWDEDKARN